MSKISNITYSSDEVTMGMLNQNGIYIAQHYDHPSEILEVKIFTPQEGYIFKNIKSVTTDNTYIQAKTIGPGDDLTLISTGKWNPSSLVNADWVDMIPGTEIAGNFTHVALLKPGSAGLEINFALTMMERRV